MTADGLSAIERLKLRLMQEGLAIGDDVVDYVRERVGERPLTLADYASTSGVSLKLEGDIWVNAPTAAYNPNFVFAPRYRLAAQNDALIIRGPGGFETPALLAPVPDYHSRQLPTHRGGAKPKGGGRAKFTDYVHTHTDRARISPVQGCAMRCKFCDIPYEFKGEYWPKPIADLLYALTVALGDPLQPASHVLISGGTPGPKNYAQLRQTYLAVLEYFPKVPVDIMMVPHPEMVVLDELSAAGVNELSLNIEIYDLDRAREIMPEKYQHGLGAYLDFIETAVSRLGPGRVRSMLMVGLEAPETTLAGVKALVERGCTPVLSPFRPDPLTPLAMLAPPAAEQLETVYLRAREIAEAAGVPLGPRCRPCMHNTLTFPETDEPDQSIGAPLLI